MNELFGILKATLEEGFVYAILAYGVYITYSILDFPDLSVDGTVPLGAVLMILTSFEVIGKNVEKLKQCKKGADV